MDIIIRIIALFFLLLSGAGTEQSAPPPPPSSEETFRSPTTIESVDALIMESFPAQISLKISGYQPDGCDFPVQVTQRREGSTITVEIFRDVPLAVMCPAMLITYDDTLKLDGTFEPGTYTILVNDFTLEVTV
jgi:hypothetical protein